MQAIKKIGHAVSQWEELSMAEDMLFSGESKNIEYKVTVPDKSEKYMKTVVAFANGRGGKIVFGIDDKTLDIVGMDVDNIYKTMDAITNAISDACEPAIRPDVALQTIKDKTVIVVEILPGAQRPYYIKSLGMVDGTYVRVAGTTRHVEGYMLKELILEGQNRYFDSEICQSMTVSDDEIERLCKSMKETAMRNTWQDSEKSKIKDVTKNVLVSWGVLKEVEGKVYPTNAYALLTGKMPQMPVIQCGVFKGTNRAHFVDRREFEGSIQEQMEGYSKPRNPAIARAFAYMKIIEKWGTGIPRLFEACEEYGLPKPELIDFDGDFRVNMYRKVESETGVNGATTQTTQATQATQDTTQATQPVSIELSEDDKAVLISIVEDPRITQKEIAAKLDWKIDRVKYYLNKLKKKEIIERVGTSQNGHWKIVVEESKWQS